MVNKWVQHVKEYAAKNNIKYNDAMKDPQCKSSYIKGSGIMNDTLNYVKNEGKKILKNETKKLVDKGANFIKNEVIGDGVGGLTSSKKMGSGIFGDIGKTVSGFVLDAAPIPGVARDVGKIGTNYLFDKSGLGVRKRRGRKPNGGALYAA